MGPFFGTIQAHVSAKAVEEEARSLLHYLLYELLQSGRSRAGSGGPHVCVMMASFLVGSGNDGRSKQGGLPSQLGFFLFWVLVDNFLFFPSNLSASISNSKVQSWSSVACSQLDGNIHGIVNAMPNQKILIPPTVVLFSQRL